MSTRRARIAAIVGAVIGLLSWSVAPAAAASNQRATDYIVVLHDGANSSAVAQEHSQRHNAQVRHVYEHAIDGYAATMSPAAAAQVDRDPRVDYVELDGEAHTLEQTLPTGVDRMEADKNSVAKINGTDERVNVDVAVIDTGIDLDHPDLNVVASTDCRYSSGGPPWSRTYSCGSGGDDGNGHGTHVAGTIGALDNGIGVVGVAPGANLWAVKVLDDNGSGSWSAVIAGIDYVADNADQIEVANMSLGGTGYNQAMRDALAGAVDKGVVVMVAAGNDGQDVFGNDGTFGTGDDNVPAAYPEVAAVSALNDTDGQPGGSGPASSYDEPDDSFIYWSNYSQKDHSGSDKVVTAPGKAIDLLMPGVDILSTVNGGGYAIYSGTSMASPHGAGLAAVHIVKNGLTPNSAADVYSIRQALIAGGQDQASGNRLTDGNLSTEPDSAYEPLGWADDGWTGNTTSNSLPTSSFTYSCTNLACDFNGTSSSDSDGSISSYEWDFGDSNTATGSTVSHAYASGGDYTVTLTVTDDDGATGSSSQTVSVTDTTSGGSTTLTVDSVLYDHFGGKTNDNHLDIYITVTDGQSTVEGATVHVTVTKTESWTDSVNVVTDSAGQVVLKYRGVGPGCYSANVTDVAKGDATYDDTADPEQTSCTNTG